MVKPALRRSSQKPGYDFDTTLGSLMAVQPDTRAAGANAMAIRWSLYVAMGECDGSHRRPSHLRQSSPSTSIT